MSARFWVLSISCLARLTGNQALEPGTEFELNPLLALAMAAVFAVLVRGRRSPPLWVAVTAWFMVVTIMQAFRSWVAPVFVSAAPVSPAMDFLIGLGLSVAGFAVGLGFIRLIGRGPLSKLQDAMFWRRHSS
jgi:hypothetical protein